MPNSVLHFIYYWNCKIGALSVYTFLLALGLYLFLEVVAYPNIIGFFPKSETKVLTARQRLAKPLARVGVVGAVGFLATGGLLLLLGIIQMLFFPHKHW